MISAKLYTQISSKFRLFSMSLCDVKFSSDKESLIWKMFYLDKSNVICLDKIKQKYNSFEILGIDSKNFTINKELLHSNYKSIQKVLHPDKN